MADDNWSTYGKKKKQAYLKGWGLLYGDDKAQTPLDMERAKQAAVAAVVKRKPVVRALGERWLEKHEQMPLVHWARFVKQIGDLLMAIPNAGKRSLIGGQHEKAMGLVAGASDLFLAMARQGFHGYFIEMKAKGKKPRPNQYVFMELVRAQGFKAEWFDNFERAQASVKEYLGLE